MAASTTTGIIIFKEVETAASVAPSPTEAGAQPSRRRHITPQAGHALEILGHAIEYLTDEYVHEGGSLSGDDGRVKAVQLLMALDRQVYFECPVVPTFLERCRTFLHLHAA